MKSWTGLWAAAAVALAASPLQAQNHVCIGQAAEPTMDGAVASDPGWNGAARIDLDLQGIIPQVYARLVRTATHVYVGLSVNTPPLAPTDDDRVVLCLSTSDVAAAWRIHIQPFTDALPGGSSTAAAVQYWRNSSTWKSNVIAQDPSDSVNPAPWLQPAQVRTYYHGASFWEMELKIPIESNLANDDNRTAVYFPPVGATFKLYVNVLQLSPSGYAFQYPWRTMSKINPTLLSGTPEPTAWGTASFDQKAGASVILIPSRMGLVAPPCPTNNVVVPYTPPAPFGDCAAIPDGHLFPTTGPANTFFAKPRNKMAAQVHVLTAFDVSDFGLPAPDDWWTVGYPAGWPAPLSNPVGPLNIAPDGEGFVALDWPLTYKQSCELAVPEKSIRAQMSRPAEDDVTVFSANPVVRSTDNVFSSVFERDARVGTRGYPATASGRQAFVFAVGKEIVPRPTGPPRIAPVSGPASPLVAAPAAAVNIRAPLPDALIYDDPAEVARRSFPPAVEQTFHWVCRGFRKTGGTFVLDDRPAKLTVSDTDPAGGFGYLSGHLGPVERWTSEFTGPGLRRLSEGLFELDVPQGQKGRVHTRIEAESFYEWQLRFRLGAAVPHGDFADAVDGGWSELVSLEYRINPMFSVEARLGVSSFDGESGGPDVYSVQHAVNGRATFLDGPWRPFVNAGPGFYANNPGDDDFGINVGAGVGYRLNDRFTLEAAWDYHHVFAEGDDPSFSTLQLGVGLKF
ncbi:MAG TPA: porin family protein [Planctomycetota bacterium]